MGFHLLAGIVIARISYAICLMMLRFYASCCLLDAAFSHFRHFIAMLAICHYLIRRRRCSRDRHRRIVIDAH